MKVQDLIDKLQKFSPDMEVTITDGLNGYFYSGDFDVEEFIDVDNRKMVDIGIGGHMDDDCA